MSASERIPQKISKTALGDDIGFQTLKLVRWIVVARACHEEVLCKKKQRCYWIDAYRLKHSFSHVFILYHSTIPPVTAEN